MRTLKIPLAVAVVVAGLIAGSVMLASSLRSPTADKDSTQSNSATDAPPPLTAEMVAILDKEGTHVTVDSKGTQADPETASRVAQIALGAFGFLTKDNLQGASLATISVDDRERITNARLWAVYLTDVRQPAFGGGKHQDESMRARMVVLVDPTRMKFTYASSF